jgi:hypothetical protein
MGANSGSGPAGSCWALLLQCLCLQPQAWLVTNFLGMTIDKKEPNEVLGLLGLRLGALGSGCRLQKWKGYATMRLCDKSR